MKAYTCLVTPRLTFMICKISWSTQYRKLKIKMASISKVTGMDFTLSKTNRVRSHFYPAEPFISFKLIILSGFISSVSVLLDYFVA